MILTVQRLVHTAVTDALRRVYPELALPAFNVEVPPNRALGDLAVTVAFQLARPLRKAPKVIAQELATALGSVPGIARIVVAPNGYLNLFLDRPAFTRARVRGEVTALPVAPEKTVVEHTAINPNKAAHIGHLRNATLGDTLARVLRFRGTPVEVQNYIDDTGVQVADVIVGFRELEKKSVDEVRHIADTTRFDYYCWDLYSRVTEWYDEDKAHLAVRAAALHDLEHGGNEIAEMGTLIVDRIVRAHLQTMARLNVSYDLLTYEGDILRLHFWAHCFETLKQQGAVYLQTEGKLKDCWVMKIEEPGSAAETSDDASAESGTSASAASDMNASGPSDMNASAASVGNDATEGREKVIVRSNGVVTYVGKDIANQFWKFGLLGKDFHYRPFMTQQTGQLLWATTSTAGDANAPSFGRASRIFNVIDSRQSYLQALLSQALRTLGHPREAENSIHFAYEMVALSHATARELGYPEDESDARKPFVEVSGRKGLGVKVDDMLDLLTAKAQKEVAARNPEFSEEECRRVASQIAVGAIRYFMLKFGRGKLIVFDIEEALSFEGETGPYLQYAAVRAQNLLNRLKDREGLSESDILGELDRLTLDEFAADSAGAPGDGHDLWSLVLEASRLDEVVEQVVRGLDFAGLAKYTFGLAQLFSAFYHRYPINNEEDRDRKLWRAAGVLYFKAQLTRALDLMGIAVPARM